MNLMFKCPEKCGQIYPFKEIVTHKSKGLCRPGYIRPADNYNRPKKVAAQTMGGQGNYGAQSQILPKSAVTSAPVKAMYQSAVTEFNRPKLSLMHLLVKDSKNVYCIDFINKKSTLYKVKAITTFPHNFQAINGPNGQLYMCGGGDYQKDEESLYNLWEIQKENDYAVVKRDSMKHPRHGHSTTWFGEKFIVVTGSRKEKNESQKKCEMYNTDIDLWFEMPDMNTGRHYHSSCTFNDRYIYVFCGISNTSRKYINQIEFYDHSKKTSWNIVDLNLKMFPERQGCGAIQRDDQNILIFGGFSGKFLKDSFLFNVNSNVLTRTAPTPSETFLF